MKKFNNPREMYLKIVKLFEEASNVLQSYIDKEDIGTGNYLDKLYNKYNEVAEHVFDKLNDESVNLEYLTNNAKSEGDFQILASFIRAYITEQILDAVASFDELVEIK